MRKIGRVWLCSKRLRNSMKRTAVIRPSTTMNRNTPCGLTADTRLSPNRLPVAGTTGVWPIGAHVVPE